MTRANTEQLKHTPWFAKAGAACSIVPISRFVGPNIFALKGGGYGCLFSLTGMDEESLTDLELESRVRSIEGALRGLPEGSCLYQYTRVMSGFRPSPADASMRIRSPRFRERPSRISGEDSGLPPDRPSLVPHAGAVEGQSASSASRKRTPLDTSRMLADLREDGDDT